MDMIMEDFKTTRQIAGYSIKDCAKKFEVSERTVINWDKKINKPSMKLVINRPLKSR
jgi:DNA-binding XRE family transcriptional regulator